MIRNIVFDMGMVLLDYNPMTTCRRLTQTEEDAQAILEALFRAPEWEEKLDAGLIEEAEMLKIAQSHLPTENLRRSCAEVLASFHTDALTPKPGMDQVVLWVKEHGFGLYLLSNAGVQFYRYQHLIPHLELFDGLLVSCEEKILKPTPAIYHRLCEKFDLRAEECLFVDDRSLNTEGAEAVGMRGYCFVDGDVDALTAFLSDLPTPQKG